MCKKRSQQYNPAGYGTMQNYPPQGGYGTKPQVSGARKFGAYLKAAVKLTFKYFFAKLLICMLMGVAAALVFRIMKVPAPALWAVLLAVGNFIPVFGQWISGAVILLGVLIFAPDKVLLVLVVMLLLQVADEFILSPLIVGKSLSFSPLLIIGITLLAGLFISGWGVIFAVPIAACIKLAFDVFYLKKDIDAAVNGE